MNKLYNKLLLDLVLPLGDKATGQEIMRLHRFYNDSQWWSHSQLKEYQETALKELVPLVYREVAVYRDLYDQAGIAPQDIQSISDLVKLPIVTKDIFRGAAAEDCVRETGMPVTKLSTSGSSGQPFTVVTDSLSMSHSRALMFLRAEMSGWDIGDPHLQTGMSLERGLVKTLKDNLLRCHYSSAFDLSNDVLDRFLDVLSSKHLKYIMGYPGSIYHIALRAKEVGFDYELHGVVTWGDNLYQHYRETIEEVFSCRVTDTYGIGEGIQVAAQCDAKEGGYHVFMPHVIVEIVDDNGVAVAPGEMGHILLTRLYPGAMPLIRYRVGDLGIKSVVEKCPCGRGSEMLDSIEGRDTDVIVTPSGNRLIVHFFTGILEYYSSVNTFRIVQESIEDLRIEIVANDDFTDQDWESITEEIHRKGDAGLNIKLDIVDEIAMPANGKRRFVVSEIA